MEYPVIVEGRQQGTLRVEREGLFTVFEARCAKREGLLRLSVYGGGREGYLGIMQPRGSGLYLKKKLSRAQLQGFPANVEYAGEAGCPGGRGGAQQSNAAASRKEPERKKAGQGRKAEKESETCS